MSSPAGAAGRRNPPDAGPRPVPAADPRPAPVTGPRPAPVTGPRAAAGEGPPARDGPDEAATGAATAPGAGLPGAGDPGAAARRSVPPRGRSHGRGAPAPEGPWREGAGADRLCSRGGPAGAGPPGRGSHPGGSVGERRSVGPVDDVGPGGGPPDTASIRTSSPITSTRDLRTYSAWEPRPKLAARPGLSKVRISRSPSRSRTCAYSDTRVQVILRIPRRTARTSGHRRRTVSTPASGELAGAVGGVRCGPSTGGRAARSG